MGNLLFKDDKERNVEGRSEWDDFGQEYLTGTDGFTSVMTAIQSKGGRVMYEWTEKISY